MPMSEFKIIDDTSNCEWENCDIETNEGWVNSVAKVLKTHKPKSRKTLVLSKAKTLTVKSKEAQAATENNLSHTGENKHKKRKELQTIRVKPVSLLERDKERNLQKIATKGIVQLFNVVSQQQKEVNKKLECAGSLEVRREKAMKNINKQVFLDVLMGDSNTKCYTPQSQASKSEIEMWGPLRSDFMTDAKLKDWDKTIDYEKEQEQEEEQESA